ncbi:aminotransferase class V-fold PLP-dependent enzyme [Gangjinia marincola]|uniref:Aminotransferase class V-fold PLP-dependent enzyme n=1 Tax=Gangjinia marincola TaxID=578463 RepID=A0ABP3XT36_9FLAO
MNNLRKHFPILNDCIYVNTASAGLLPEPVLAFRREHDQSFFERGSLFKDQQIEFLTTYREEVGRFFECPPNQVALVPNFSFGYNMLMEGVKEGSKILLLTGDYPSVNWGVTFRTFEVVYANLDENLEQNIAEAVKSEKPDFLCLSLVQYINGIKIDFHFLDQLKKNYPNLSIIADGTQYLGTERFSFRESGIDVLIASGYKWMNGGYGNALMLFKEHIPAIIFPRSLGFGSVKGKYKPEDGSFIGRLEPGHQDTLNHGSLVEGLKLHTKIGRDEVQQQNYNLAMYAKEKFTEFGLLEDEVVARANHSTIFNIKGDQQLFDDLSKEKVICSQRGDGLRLSFHFYNTLEEIDLIYDLLKRYR